MTGTQTLSWKWSQVQAVLEAHKPLSRCRPRFAHLRNGENSVYQAYLMGRLEGQVGWWSWSRQDSPMGDSVSGGGGWRLRTTVPSLTLILILPEAQSGVPAGDQDPLALWQDPWGWAGALCPG